MNSRQRLHEVRLRGLSITGECHATGIVPRRRSLAQFARLTAVVAAASAAPAPSRAGAPDPKWRRGRDLDALSGARGGGIFRDRSQPREGYAGPLSSRSSSSAASRGFRPAAGQPRLARSHPAARGRSPLAVVFVTVFLDLVGFGIVIPLLPLYAERFGAGPVAAAWLLAVYSLMQFLFAPGWGRLSDRVGRRPVLLVGLFGLGALVPGVRAGGVARRLFVARAASGHDGRQHRRGAGVHRRRHAAAGPGQGDGDDRRGVRAGLHLWPGDRRAALALGAGVRRSWAPAALAAANCVLAWFRLPESLPPEARAAQPAATPACARAWRRWLDAPRRLRRPVRHRLR